MQGLDFELQLGYIVFYFRGLERITYKMVYFFSWRFF